MKTSSPRLRILLVTLCSSGESFSLTPRGTYAILHYLQKFGHEVGFLDRSESFNPWRLLKIIRSRRPEILLVQHLIAGELALFKKMGLISCPIVHSWDDYYAEQSRFPTWLIWPLEVLGVRWVDHVTSTSQYNLHLAGKWGVPSTYIPHGTTEEKVETKLKLQSSRTRVCYLGDQSPYKGMGRLMETVDGLDCDLFMVGKTNPLLQKTAPSNVHFLGVVSPGEVQGILAQADILVNPSNQDSNFKFFEYLRAGKPILGIKGKPEWAFQNGVDALLVDDLREGLDHLIRDESLRQNLAKNSSLRESLTWEESVRKLEKVLFQVARGKPKDIRSEDG